MFPTNEGVGQIQESRKKRPHVHQGRRDLEQPLARVALDAVLVPVRPVSGLDAETSAAKG